MIENTSQMGRSFRIDDASRITYTLRPSFQSTLQNCSESSTCCCRSFFTWMSAIFFTLIHHFLNLLQYLFCCEDTEKTAKITNQEIETRVQESKEFQLSASAKATYPFLNAFPLANEHIADIHTIFHILALATEKPTLLVLKKSDLTARGNNIKDLHPLRFFAYILTTPSLVKDLWIIRQASTQKKSLLNLVDSFDPWKQFVSNLVASLKKQNKKGTLEPHIKDFARFIEIDLIKVQPYFEKSQWENLIRDTLFDQYINNFIKNKEATNS